MKKGLFGVSLIIILLVLSCDEDNAAIVPANLTINIEVATDGSGVVEVQAVAENAATYRIFFGERYESAVEAADGRATHTYTASGTYAVTVQAYSTDNRFISGSKEISVLVPVRIPEGGYSSPLSYDGMSMVWQDEFNGTLINKDGWTFETGTGSNGWGNNELQYYLEENTILQDGHLVIAARRESRLGSSYTSSRMITRGKRSFLYGRVDVRAVLPKGQGIWPAIWMLGENIGTVGWPKCGEIDIMEMIGGQGRENTVHGTVHWDNNNSHASYGGDFSLGTGDFSEMFHVFSIVWTGTSITWYVDDVKYHEIDITPEGLSEFHDEFFVIFNVAVGGAWPGNPDGETAFPQHLIIDYIRVFQK